MTVKSTACLAIGLAAAWYTLAWLPKSAFFAIPGVSGPYAAAAASVSLVLGWFVGSRRGWTVGLAACFAMAGGFAGLFWPAFELLFYGIDGGTMSLGQKIFYSLATVLSAAGVLASVMMINRPRLARLLFVVAAAGLLLITPFAPVYPKSARLEALFGLPLLGAGAGSAWLGRDHSRE